MLSREKKQAFNPYLPSYEYVPDGEPHVFGNRIYIYGSHDRFNGADYCLNDYICYSADVNDLTDWKYEGVIFRKEQDPRNQQISADAPEPQGKHGVVPKNDTSLNPPGIHALFAPDVVKGLDGKYYLFYCLTGYPEISVAVCDEPAGQYDFLGYVRHEDGTPLGQKEDDWSQFDPGVFIDDNGRIYVYSGFADKNENRRKKSPGSMVMELCTDMLTLKEAPKRLLPSAYESEGTGYEGHEFFEASSLRKINGIYYLIYSSIQSHELCYAVSDQPDKNYQYGGTIVDIGDIFLDGRTNGHGVNMTGNTHGSLECIKGQWYIFYHRQTNETDFSRQACAEKVYLEADGSIKQVEITSCGLNDGALEGKGIYPARIACHLNRWGQSTWSNPNSMKQEYPYFTQDMDDAEPSEALNKQDREFPIQYIHNIQNETMIGYKYFKFQDVKEIALMIRGKGEGRFIVSTSIEGDACGEICVKTDSEAWGKFKNTVTIPDGVHALYFVYKGLGSLDMATLSIE